MYVEATAVTPGCLSLVGWLFRSLVKDGRGELDIDSPGRKACDAHGSSRQNCMRSRDICVRMNRLPDTDKCGSDIQDQVVLDCPDTPHLRQSFGILCELKNEKYILPRRCSQQKKMLLLIQCSSHETAMLLVPSNLDQSDMTSRGSSCCAIARRLSARWFCPGVPCCFGRTFGDIMVALVRSDGL